MLDNLPDIVILQIAQNLDFGANVSFMKSSRKVHDVLLRSFRRFTHVQISDEASDSFLKAESRSLPNGEHLAEERVFFNPSQVEDVFELCVNLQHVVLAVKLSGTKAAAPLTPLQQSSSSPCHLFETSLYARGGFIARFMQLAPQGLLKRLKSVCLNVDLMVESFSQLAVPCPTEDLRYAVQRLSNQPFQTFIQIGFCASEFRDEDNEVNCMLLSAMHTVRYEMQMYGCKAGIEAGDDEYYCDLTIEAGNLEYSFAFFYYNPNFCEPSSFSGAPEDLYTIQEDDFYAAPDAENSDEGRLDDARPDKALFGLSDDLLVLASPSLDSIEWLRTPGDEDSGSKHNAA